MILTRSSLHKIGWAMILTICFAMLLALTFKVNAVKSEVRLTERKILAARQERDLLETEFETRSNQHQLSALNEVNFGYAAPTPGQYLESERQLAALGKARPANAPAPIMVVNDDAGDHDGAPAMVNPLTGKASSGDAVQDRSRKVAVAAPVAMRFAQADRRVVSGKAAE